MRSRFRPLWRSNRITYQQLEFRCRAAHPILEGGFNIQSQFLNDPTGSWTRYQLIMKQSSSVWLQTCQDLNCAVFVHPWDMPSLDGRHSKYWLPWLVGMPMETATAICSMLMGGVLHRFPDLKVCFAHGGGSYPFTIGRVEHGYRVRPDLCAIDCSKSPRELTGRFYTDSLVHDPDALKMLVKVIGEVRHSSLMFRSVQNGFLSLFQDRVILGSDYPFPLGEHAPGSLIDSMDEFDSHLKVFVFRVSIAIHSKIIWWFDLFL